MYGGGRKWLICFNSDTWGPTIRKSPSTNIWPKVPAPVSYQLPQQCCITNNHKPSAASSNTYFCLWVCGLAGQFCSSELAWVGLAHVSAVNCGPAQWLCWFELCSLRCLGPQVRQLGCLGSVPCGLSSSNRLTKLVLMNKKGIKGTQAFWGLGPELAQPHFHHILSAKASHKASPDLKAGKALRSHIAKSVNIGRGQNRTIFGSTYESLIIWNFWGMIPNPLSLFSTSTTHDKLYMAALQRHHGEAYLYIYLFTQRKCEFLDLLFPFQTFAYHCICPKLV